MGKLIEEILFSPGSEDPEQHPGDEDLARLADGQVKGRGRDELINHVNRCSRCHAVLTGILEDKAAMETDRQNWFAKLTRSPLALAASVAFILFIGIGVFQQQTGSPDLIRATLTMNAEMRALIVEGGEHGWQNQARIDRLAGLLQKNGVKVKGLTKVVMTKPYMPSKSFFGPKEKVEIRIEDGVIYLEVVEEKAKEN